MRYKLKSTRWLVLDLGD